MCRKESLLSVEQMSLGEKSSLEIGYLFLRKLRTV